jgi:hypothetical protein
LPFLGIDLGTTNSGFAFAPDGDAKVELFPISQLVAPGELRDEPLLDSCLYLAREGEFPPGALDLPWRDNPAEIAGLLAARRGAETAGRLVASAKSWLSAPDAARTDPILPDGAPEGARHVSPLEASRHYLEHLRLAWDYVHSEEPFHRQPVTLTVPASFDPVARQLTQKAAAEAGYRNLTLLEEPQAAFYAWLERHPDWRDLVRPGHLVLVIDVGGGTTDLTLISVTDKSGSLELERLAVGRHLLLGGDNMDLALAHSVSARLPKLDRLQFQALWRQCRLAKEALFSSPDLTEHPVTLLGRGSSLVGGTLKATLTRAEVETLLVDGFFPAVSSTDMPARRPAGLAEAGLPYESDPAVTRHLAAFLRHTPNGPAWPTHVLFNGGVFKAVHLRNRVIEVLNRWLAAENRPPVTPLEGDDLMHAVARGAAWFGHSKATGGVRIRGGVPRTCYLGIETAMPAVPGLRPPLKALTVAPFGMEEGSGAPVPGREFSLVTGEAAEFRFFASIERKSDKIGEMLDEIPDELEELAPVRVTLAGDPGTTVRVSLETQVTETGVLELYCVARDGRRWKLEFDLRQRRLTT